MCAISSISSKKREPGKLNKLYLTLNAKIKILNGVEKRKLEVEKLQKPGKFEKLTRLKYQILRKTKTDLLKNLKITKGKDASISNERNTKRLS